MMVRPFFSFYGGKWRDAKRYPEPQLDTIVEPFAGSAGYALRYADRRVLLYDVDPVIVGVWDYLISVSEQELLGLPDLPEGGTVDDLDVPEEARWLIGFWLNRGKAQPARSPSSWMRSGVRPGSFWGERVRQRLASQLKAIRHWRVFHGDYTSARNRRATWFIDPTYMVKGSYYRYTVDDFDALAAWCQQRMGQVIVCEQVGAPWLPFEPLHSARATRNGTRSPEAIDDAPSCVKWRWIRRVA